MRDLESLARKILARFAYFLQDGFYWAINKVKLAINNLKNVYGESTFLTK